MTTPDILETTLIEHCQTHDGAMSFQAFMEAALYTPQLGYYQNTLPKFGKEGDFITAPHVSPIFGQCVAQFCAKQLAQLPKEAVLLELGAGNGQLAVDILQSLHAKSQLPHQYWILEPSAYLQSVQQAALKAAVPAYYENIIWLTSLPDTFDGVLIANEVLDALPVARFRLHPETGQIEEEKVVYENEWALQYGSPQTPHLTETVKSALSTLEEELPKGYTSEINLMLPAFIKSFAEKLNQGTMLFIDYGFPRYEYYHPQRTQGTLMCHYRHKTHSNPLINIGEQDITAHVDFTQLAMSAKDAGLDVLGFCTQANFLIYAGLADCLNQDLDYKAQLQQSQAVQTLTLPHEMGELFKVMILGKNIDELIDFEGYDQRYRL